MSLWQRQEIPQVPWPPREILISKICLAFAPRARTGGELADQGFIGVVLLVPRKVPQAFQRMALIPSHYASSTT